MLGARMSAAGEGMSLFSSFRGRNAKTLHRLEDKQARVLENSRCPKCGSQSFDQVTVQA
jgi:hypothetical protein